MLEEMYSAEKKKDSGQKKQFQSAHFLMRILEGNNQYEATNFVAKYQRVPFLQGPHQAPK